MALQQAAPPSTPPAPPTTARAPASPEAPFVAPPPRTGLWRVFNVLDKIVSPRKQARVKRFARRASGFFPLTAVGTTITAVALFAGWYQGVGHLDYIVLMVAFCALVALAIMCGFLLIAFLISLRVFARPVGRTVGELEAEAVSPTGFAVRLPWWLPFFDISWTWEDDDGTCPAEITLHREGRDTHEVAVPKRRGLYFKIVRKIQVRDILGLTCWTWRKEEPIAIRVLPHRGKVEQLVPMMGFVSGDDISDPYGDPWGDRVDMRQYSPGDSPRMIMWKVFARSRKLMVRVPERAVAARPRGCGYLIADVSKHPVDEAGAGVARIMLERHLLGEGWSFAADGAGAPATVVNDALDVLAKSGTPAISQTGFPDFIQKAEREGYGYCVLFVPPRPGPWLDVLVDTIRHSPVRVHAFIGVDGLASDLDRARRRGGLLRRLVLQNDGVAGPTVGELTDVVTKLSAITGQVVLIDRAAGQIFANPLAILGRKEAS